MAFILSVSLSPAYYKKAYMEQHWGMKSLDKSGFTRHLHRLSDTLFKLFAPFGQALKALHTGARYVIDSFSVAVCHNSRIGRNQLRSHEAYRGRCASERRWFYGFKVQIVATTDSIPMEFYVHAGSEADITGLRHLTPDLPESSVLHTDAGFTDHSWEDLFTEATGNSQQTTRNSNSARPHVPHETFLLQHFRKTIEMAFSQLTARFPKQIHAVTARGFVLKIALFIFVHALDKAGL